MVRCKAQHGLKRVQTGKGKTMTIAKESKRILSVTIKQIADYDADTSDLGEYSDEAKPYAIVQENARGEYGGQFVDQLPCECGHTEAEHHSEFGTCHECPDLECETFNRVTIERGREYRYFNPAADNYAGIDDAEVRRYCLQDFERMRDLQRGEWGYIGIKAEAVVKLTGDLTQRISSGGLWGIESDSDPSDFRSIEHEQLDDLRDELHAMGFSKRAVTAAFRTIERKDS